MILLGDGDIETHRVVSRGPLAPLADSLRADLGRVLERPLFVPEEKAKLSRRGGRCAHDGTMLEFDPFSPRSHRCPTCGRTHEGEAHYRWWIMGYQLWLAERAVHAAVLHLLRKDVPAASFARAVLGRYAELYPCYPNADNVLGPTRPFFSTYLESIWLLQLCVAASALDAADGGSPATESLRDQVIAPSAALIRSYDEGPSNRQVWNAAALAAAGSILGDRALLTQAVEGPSGIIAHLEHGLLPDGSWYEGENYHLFAHRGLWYGLRLAHVAGIRIDEGLIARFDEGSATPFLTALPDMTFPARRDSPYGVSLRQWRFAELAELGLARRPEDRRLRGALHELYDPSVSGGESQRWRSTAEAERNAPPGRLTRADLGWRSLLFAMPELPALASEPRTSAILAAQGFAVMRRDAGRVYVGFDFGLSGGGHGHPDRLNLLLADGPTRWLDDMGTGSYVDPSLHWYRSTMAHNAPAVNGRSQKRVDGALLSWDERGGIGWIEARVDDVAPGVGILRTLVVCPDYIVDRLIWWGAADTQLDLPIHRDGEIENAVWRPADAGGSMEPEDGYRWLRDVELLAPVGVRELHVRSTSQESTLDGFLILPVANDARLWRATAPGPPAGSPAARRFHFVRAAGARGTIVSVWSWRGAVRAAHADGDDTVVALAAGGEHRHGRSPHGWRVGFTWKGARSSIELTGRVDDAPAAALPAAASGEEEQVFEVPVSSDADFDGGASLPALEFELEGRHYRKSEAGWHEAGEPRARVALMATPTRLIIEVAVTKEPLVFAPRREENDLDNEHPDTNSDGVQLYLMPRSAVESSVASWILVPETDGRVRITPRGAAAEAIPLTARWRPAAGGWEIRCTVPPGAVAPNGAFRMDVIVNEIPLGRERRRGQLVLSGGAGEFTYLRGDRQPESRLLTFHLARA